MRQERAAELHARVLLYLFLCVLESWELFYTRTLQLLHA
jgi:hypothetical protein